MERLTYKLLILVAAAAMIGCGGKSVGKGGTSGGGQNYNPGGVPPVTDPDIGVTPDSGGSTVSFVPVSTSTLSLYTGWTVNTPSDFKLTVNLKKATYSSNGTTSACDQKSTGGCNFRLGGYIGVSFKDNTSTYTDTFASLHNPGAVTGTTDWSNNKYNLLTTDYPELDGKVGYHGFFEDVRGRSNTSFPVFGGAVILVIDELVDLGDGAGPSTANGSIWFKNYTGYAPVSPTSCWFVSVGPYDCRSWKKDNGGVNTTESIYPNSKYIKLGDFYDLDMKKAINGDL